MSNTIIIHEPHSEITPVLSRHERFRFWLQGKHPALRFGYKIIIGIAGFSTILVGPRMVTYFRGFSFTKFRIHFCSTIKQMG
jgi:hypothetical protein